jgi:hypothetical protein
MRIEGKKSELHRFLAWRMLTVPVYLWLKTWQSLLIPQN